MRFVLFCGPDRDCVNLFASYCIFISRLFAIIEKKYYLCAIIIKNNKSEQFYRTKKL